MQCNLCDECCLTLVAAEVVGDEQQRLLYGDALHRAEVGPRQRRAAQLAQPPEHRQQQQRVLHNDTTRATRPASPLPIPCIYTTQIFFYLTILNLIWIIYNKHEIIQDI